MKVKLLSSSGHSALEGVDFPIIVEADLYKGMYYVKNVHINDVAPSVTRELGVEYVFSSEEVVDLTGPDQN